MSVLKVHRYGGGALSSVSALDADALVQSLEESVFESSNERLHLRLVARRYFLGLGTTRVSDG